MKREIWRHFDFLLFGAVIVLSVFGIAMIRSAVAGNIELEGYVTRQIIFVAIGLVVIISTAIVDYHYWASITKLMYAFTFVLLIIVFVSSKARFGAARWIETGLVSIQPAELAKVVIILVLADFFARSQNDPHDLKWIARSFLILAGFLVWIVLQPNLSTTIVLAVIWFSLLWISGLKVRYLTIFTLVGIFGSLAAFPLLAPYQQQRILSFVLPEQNATYGNAYNVDQALIAIGSGGLLGQGYGHGSTGAIAFFESSAYGLYLFGDGRRIRLRGNCYRDRSFTFCNYPNF